MSRLPAPLVDKLGRLIPRLASDHDGEILNTVAALRRTLKSSGRDLHDLARSLVPSSAQAPSGWRDMVEACQANSGSLNERERAFIRNMAGWTGEPTAKQRQWLEGIYAKVQRGGFAAGGRR